jgi:nitroimidazol reductase NimA-like FMN-containing flavoprotein (pyridoxamine 5'-phosphate oxidase superfamily)
MKTSATDEREVPRVTTPVTTIDRRYSDPDAVATDWDETCRVLETAQLFWISTVRADGRPHVTPVVAVWVDGVLYFSTGDHEQKAANMLANPHVILTTGCNHWDTGLDVVVEGDAVRVTDHEVLERLAEVWATRWDGRWQHEVRDGGFRHTDGETVLPHVIHVFSVTPTQIVAHAKGDPFSHTTHRFA